MRFSVSPIAMALTARADSPTCAKDACHAKAALPAHMMRYAATTENAWVNTCFTVFADFCAFSSMPPMSVPAITLLNPRKPSAAESAPCFSFLVTSYSFSADNMTASIADDKPAIAPFTLSSIVLAIW
ncbi:hypothetical protein Barb4_03353 [Bacteroidales bacterium Barb4]|nr:hypothetical protein Barb4_03353 [Bacteroidales bacterium Barb4]